MPDTQRLNDGANVSGLTLTQQGFLVNGGTSANIVGVEYHWTAVAAVAGEIVVGAYVGDGQANRTIADGSLILVRPTLLLLQGESRRAVFRSDSVPASQDLTFPVEEIASLTGAITTLLPSGFEVGADPHANAAGGVFRWVIIGTEPLADGGTDGGSDPDAGADAGPGDADAGAADAGLDPDAGPDAGGGPDAGLAPDGGNPELDAGILPDSGSDVDAGGDGAQQAAAPYDVGCGCRSAPEAATLLVLLLGRLGRNRGKREKGTPRITRRRGGMRVRLAGG